MITKVVNAPEHRTSDDNLTVEEAAKALRVSTSTLRRRIRCGDLPAYRMGGRRLWVRREDLTSLMSPIHPAANGEEDEEDDLDRPLTDEERERGLAALEAMATLSARMLAERGGVLFSPSEDLIREAREERTRELSDLLDASVAVKWIFREEDSEKALSLARNSMLKSEPIIAPHLLPFEVVNAIRQRMRREVMREDDVKRLLADFFATPITFVPAGRMERLTIHRRALELAAQFGLPATYDAHYLALSEMRRCPLWTSDRRLVNALEGRFPLIRWLGDYTAA